MSKQNNTSGSGGVRNNSNRNNHNRNKNRRNNKSYNNNKVKSEGPKIQPKSYKPNNKPKPTFTELQYSDKVIFVLGAVTLLMSIFMWFMGYREEATYIGIWVPGIFSAATFIRMSFTRARRK